MGEDGPAIGCDRPPSPPKWVRVEVPLDAAAFALPFGFGWAGATVPPDAAILAVQLEGDVNKFAIRCGPIDVTVE